MDQALIAKYQLEWLAPKLAELARPCLRGRAADTVEDSSRKSYCGGLPYVDDGFSWPIKNERPLHFVAQIACQEVPHWPKQEGALLFFYDDAHWGFSSSDRGYIKVLWQKGQRLLEPTEVPTARISRLFGLWKQEVRPRSYRRVPIVLEPGLSYPSLEHPALKFPDEAAEEAYCEFLEELVCPIQIGGYPDPIQADQMEQECAEATGQIGPWVFLLQLGEIGDQVWGDAGALYWFAPEQDLTYWNFDRCWMISQCH